MHARARSLSFVASAAASISVDASVAKVKASDLAASRNHFVLAMLKVGSAVMILSRVTNRPCERSTTKSCRAVVRLRAPRQGDTSRPKFDESVACHQRVERASTTSLPPPTHTLNVWVVLRDAGMGRARGARNAIHPAARGTSSLSLALLLPAAAAACSLSLSLFASLLPSPTTCLLPASRGVRTARARRRAAHAPLRTLS